MTDARRRQRDSHRAVRWLWTNRGLGARAARVLLLPLSAVWLGSMTLRRWMVRSGLRPQHALPRPAVGVGNLSVGGSGKTPIAAWIATHFQDRGVRSAILLRGVGGDETLVHRELVPEAIVVADPDRVAGAARATAEGADVLVLDDAYQRLELHCDLNICLVSAESSRAVRWPLPAGPWREGLPALVRADWIIVTHKRADRATAERFAAALHRRTRCPVSIARLGISVLSGLESGREHPLESVAGRRVVAATAIADPAAFVGQLQHAGAQVQVASWKDHHQFDDGDVAWLAHAARKADLVVITAKDAVKLRGRWPASVREPVVARLQVHFEAGEAELREALDRVTARTAR